MAWGSVTIRVRPIRVAFLVDPNDKAGLYRAIELNTFLWGGSYNPIIPAYRRTPARWEDIPVRHLPSPSEIIDGYLDGFDPDCVVPIGVCADRTFATGNREIVKADDLIGNFEDSASPRYGIGFIELLEDCIEKEFKYKRNDDLKIVLPELPRAYRLFLASVFGVLPEKARQIIDKHFLGVIGITKERLSLARYTDILAPQKIFPRKLTSWALDKRPLQDALLFVCDAKSTQDIIDYWNLQAAGYYVIPVPIQIASEESVKNLGRKFIEENYRPYKGSPTFHRTTVQKSRSLSKKSVEIFCQSLNGSKNENGAKYSMQWWYPRLWDAWARENTSAGIAFPYSHEENRDIAKVETSLKMRSLDPKIKIFHAPTVLRFANECSFSFYGSKEAMAEVLPEGGRKLSSAMVTAGYRNWRFSRFGPVFLADSKHDLIFLNLPLAETVMTAWLREQGWKISLSVPGRIATQLMKQIGGPFGITLLAHKGVIELFKELEKETGMSRQSVLQKLKEIIKDDKLFFTDERFLELLLKSNALRLGAKIQCPICTRYNWYELDVLDYELACRFCLSKFSPPLQSPKNIEWTYRAHGPFASSIAQGSFTVLLTLNCLSRNHNCPITPLFSYTAEKDGKVLEADITCLYKPSAWRETRTQVVHAECKSFNFFERQDVNRMKNLAKEFPGSILVFATLKDSLENSEIEIISPLVQKEHKKRLQGKPYSPVIVLTGIELFSLDHIPYCWRDRNDLYEKFHNRYGNYSDLSLLADTTQQIYLKLPSWHEWSEAEWTKRRQKKQHAKVREMR